MNGKTPERELLIERAVSSFRERDAAGRILPSPAWLDLPDADREHAYELRTASRRLEALVAEDGLSVTGREVVSRARRIEQLRPGEEGIDE